MHWVVLAVAVLSACKADDPFICKSDTECVRTGLLDGKCEASNCCSFPDTGCPTGRRYDVLAGLSGECVPDEDSDGIADDGDNCAGISNPQQFDEDKDGRGDECDPCPPFSETIQGAGDDDNDGVGNLCDPRPTTAGDKILLFEGFHAPLPVTWSVNGTAIIENDGLTLQGMREVTLPMQSTGSQTLMASVAMVQTPALGIWLGLPYQSGVGGAYCELNSMKLQLWATQASVTLVSEAPFAAKLDTPYIYTIQRSPAMQYTCSARTTATATAITVTGGAFANATIPAIKVGCDVPSKFGWILLTQN